MLNTASDNSQVNLTDFIQNAPDVQFGTLDPPLDEISPVEYPTQKDVNKF